MELPKPGFAIADALLARLACPRDGQPLALRGNVLQCPHDHQYPVHDGVPVMLLDEARQTLGVAGASLHAAWRRVRGESVDDQWCIETLGLDPDQKFSLRRDVDAGFIAPVDPAARYLIAATNGMMYRHLIGRLSTYPIPELRLPPGQGEWLLDIGCNWGRWCVAAGRLGYRPIGIDPSLGAVLAARRVCRQLGIEAQFVVGDARHLPFRDASFHSVYSYSVLQHFPKADATASFSEALRVLLPGRTALIQMPNWAGIRCLYHQARRGFAQPSGFGVRYWGLGEIEAMVAGMGSRARFTVDCFFGIGLQASDLPFMGAWRSAIVRTSETLRRLSTGVPALTRLADSVFVWMEK